MRLLKYTYCPDSSCTSTKHVKILMCTSLVTSGALPHVCMLQGMCKPFRADSCPAQNLSELRVTQPSSIQCEQDWLVPGLAARGTPGKQWHGSAAVPAASGQPPPVCVLLHAAASCFQPGFQDRLVHHVQLLLQLQQCSLLLFDLCVQVTLRSMWFLDSDGHSGQWYINP